MDNDINNFNIIQEDYSSDEDASPLQRELSQELHIEALTRSYKKLHSDPNNYKVGQQPRYPAVIQVNSRERRAIRDHARNNSRIIQEDQDWNQNQEPLYHKLKSQRLHNLKTLITRKFNRDCVRECKKWVKRHPRSSTQERVWAFWDYEKRRNKAIDFCTVDPSGWDKRSDTDFRHPGSIYLEICWNKGRNRSIYRTLEVARRLILSRRR